MARSKRGLKDLSEDFGYTLSVIGGEHLRDGLKAEER